MLISIFFSGSDSKGPSHHLKHAHHSTLSSAGMPHSNNGPVSAAGKLSSLFGAGGNTAEQEHGMQLQKELNARLQSVLEDTILKNIKLQVSPPIKVVGNFFFAKRFLTCTYCRVSVMNDVVVLKSSEMLV